MLVERSGVLGEFDDCLAEACSGRGRMLFVAGEAGVGKSSVVREFAAASRDRVGVSPVRDRLSPDPPGP